MLRIKILSMGDCATGKSCLIKRYCEERFVAKYISTIGIDYGVKPTSLSGRDIRVNFWDMSGSESFFEVRNEFYKDASGAILVYDVANRTTFDSLPAWLEEARKYGAGNDIPIILVANKVDKRRTVMEAEGVAFAAANGLTHWETSAQSGANCNDLFEALFKEVVSRPPIG
jgi:DnaJ family protein C protein 27